MSFSLQKIICLTWHTLSAQRVGTSSAISAFLLKKKNIIDDPRRRLQSGSSDHTSPSLPPPCLTASHSPPLHPPAHVADYRAELKKPLTVLAVLQPSHRPFHFSSPHKEERRSSIQREDRDLLKGQRAGGSCGEQIQAYALADGSLACFVLWHGQLSENPQLSVQQAVSQDRHTKAGLKA